MHELLLLGKEVRGIQCFPWERETEATKRLRIDPHDDDDGWMITTQKARLEEPWREV